VFNDDFLEMNVHLFKMGQCGIGRYKNDPEILAMTNLVAAYQRNEILEFEKILKVCYLVFQMNSGCM
jgi:hypothetical protein